MAELVHVERRGRVLVISMRREAKRNAIDWVIAGGESGLGTCTPIPKFSRSVDKHGSFHLRAGRWANGLFRSNTKRSTLHRSPALQDNSFTRRR